MLSKSANPLLATPSQAPTGEGVETGWEPPDRVVAKVKAQSRPRTLAVAAAKAEVARDQETLGSTPSGAIGGQLQLVAVFLSKNRGNRQALAATDQLYRHSAMVPSFALSAQHRAPGGS